ESAAVVTEAAQCGFTDRVAGLLAQIAEHVFRRVVVADRLLLLRAAARVDDAAALRRRAAAFEALGDDHGRAAFLRGDRGRRAGAAEADDEHVAGPIPLHRAGVGRDQWRRGRQAAVDTRFVGRDRAHLAIFRREA